MTLNTDITRRSSILLVDDDLNSLRILHSILDGIADITFAKSGKEALAQITQLSPDLVLLDTDMPGMGGYETCAALKANPETADLPVVFVTSFTNPESETLALSIGAADFIHKPVNPPVLLARVKTQLALKQKTDELRRLMAQDALTGIANRRAFDDALVQEWRRAWRTGEPLSVLIMDIDHFKQFNDTYGHLAGDECLRKVAQALAHSARRAGDFAARYGGEEFVFILPHTKATDAHAFAEQVCMRVRDLAIPHRDSITVPVVTLSIGLATLVASCSNGAERVSPCSACSLMPSCEAAPSTLVEQADQALYVAKQQGRNRVVSFSEMPDVVDVWQVDTNVAANPGKSAK